ncbi:MAG: MoaD/ThiS family protein [Alphaproteobacteria bacterium]
MARVILGSGLRRFTGGVDELDIEAATIKQLLAKLGALYPKLTPLLERGLAVAINGTIYQGALLEPIPPDAEVHLLPPIEGG